VPDPKQELAVGGPVLERVKRRLTLVAIRLVRLPIRILTFPITRLREEVMSLRAAAVESLAYVGVELRRLGDLIERGSPAGQFPPTRHSSAGEARTVAEAPFAFRSLAAVHVPGPVLVVGAGGHGIDQSLASLGYEVSQVGLLEEVSGKARAFAAVLYLSARPDPEELARIDELLADEGVLVMSVAFGEPGGNGTAVFDQGALDVLLSGWAVADRLVISSGPDEHWKPVQNGGTPEQGVALVAARRRASRG
jgi:hypothetical protein